MRQKSFDTIYRNVPRHRVDELLEFRSTHSMQRRSIDGMEWNYILSGKGSEAILIMGGLTSTADTAHSWIAKLEKTYRVLVPSYPLYETMGAFVDGLVKLLELEGIEQIHFFGSSLGAGVGHVLIRRYPDRVNKLILSAFGLYNSRKLKQTEQFLRLYQLLPYWLVSQYYKAILPSLLKGVDEDEKLFWIAYMRDLLDHQNNKRTLMSQYQMLVDLFENASTYNIDESVSSHCVLILQAKDDKGFDRSEQESLRLTYPNANVHLFEEGGHLAGMKQGIEYDEILYRFLASEPT